MKGGAGAEPRGRERGRRKEENQGTVSLSGDRIHRKPGQEGLGLSYAE